MVNEVLYLSTALYRAAAIDAHTGATLWVHDPKAYESGSPPPLPWRHRGLAYWENGDAARLFWGTGDGFLISVDAATGLPAVEFSLEKNATFLLATRKETGLTAYRAPHEASSIS